MSNNFLNNPVQVLKMIGLRRAEVLNKLNIYKVKDLLYHFPRRYDDRTCLKPGAYCEHGETVTLHGTVLAGQELRPRRGLTVTKLGINDGQGIFYGVWFNQPFVRKNLQPGTKLFVTGKVEKGYGHVQVKVEEYEVDDGNDSLGAGRLAPVYPLSAGLNQRLLRTVVFTALDAI